MTDATKTLPTSLRALLTNLVDYAGLFPPAKLDMAPTVRNYAQYLAGDDAWMLGRLIVPVARLAEFEQHAEALLPRGEDDEPWRISALTAAAGDAALEDDLEAIASFNERHAVDDAGRALIDVIELKAARVEDIEAALDAVPDDLFPYFEIAIDRDPRGLTAALSGLDAGAKVRTGGPAAALHPAPADLARFINACAATDVPFKATAGLHHPLRHYAEAVGTEQFGFLNVFLGAAFAWAYDVPLDDLEAMLVETSPDGFVFENDTARRGEHELTAEQIDDARLTFAISFGSCSFDEPREDLRALGML